MQRDFHSLSVQDQLYRLAELAKQPYRRSSRERRACVAVIFRLAQPNTPVQPSPPPPSPTSPSPSSPPTPPPFPPTGYSRYLSPTPSYPRLISQLHSLIQSPFISTSSLQLLFIQRALNPNDRWSGQMALPGGRQQRGESDFITAVREVWEEVGLTLWDESQWLFIGRIDDRHIESFGGVKPLAVCPFLFLQRTPITPRLSMEQKEVHAVVFTPLSFFTDPQLRWDYLVHPLVKTWRGRWRGKRRVDVGYFVRKKSTATATSAPTSPSSLRRLLPSITSLSSVHFPALALPGHFETADGRHGVSLRDTLLYQHSPEEQRQRQQHQVTRRPSPSVDSDEGGEEEEEEEGVEEGGGSELTMDVDIEAGAFILWGFTLTLLSDLLLSFHCNSLSQVLEKGQKDRQRTLRVLYRTIDVMDGVEKRWKEVKETTGRLVREVRGVKEKEGEGGEEGAGLDVTVHRDVVAAASTEEETQRRKEEVVRRQQGTTTATAPPVSKL